ncbi:hypothetical protein CNMCM5793_002666 [Aspergillus hiratsukae]|uniref:Uncharacterized protein n=1 Tax=Aspergillus hiratsukae TaxID=1194566 RepID=A0A8H6P1N2_9EURO|nr:hypothetical protein CNMCM5793_002666 [Aspergillus hiratsukae]KAF7158103.1 hypothetical protein CNMCM6106_004425 [Aspergillus hiratsukae]
MRRSQNMERDVADLNGSKLEGTSPEHGVRHATQSALLISCGLDSRPCCKDMLEIDDDEDVEMGVLESHLDAIYKADLRAADQFIRTDEGS